MSDTLFDSLVDSLKRARDVFNSHTHVAPVALLWPDQKRHWEPLQERLRDELPILTLGPQDPAGRSGSSYWIRCVVEGALEDVDGTPVIYLPGWSRADLRAVDECPSALAPIAELQYRGAWFSHPNGKDWTIGAWLANEDGLGVDVSHTQSTIDLLTTALPQLMAEQVKTVERLSIVDAAYLRRLVSPDLMGDILRWLEDPAAAKARLGSAGWDAFRATCRDDFAGFDPDADGLIEGGRRLGERAGRWDRVWWRFAEAPHQYPGVRDLLRRAKPAAPQPGFFDESVESWPQDNEDAEAAVREQLGRLEGETAATVRERVRELWTHHLERQRWVWAQLDQAPMVDVLEYLDALADLTELHPAGSSVDDLASSHADHGWQADDAVLRTLAATPTADQGVVGPVVDALYRPWVEAGAKALQDAVGAESSMRSKAQPSVSATPGTAVVFVDGLRLDLGHRLVDELSDLRADLDVVLPALPTVTATSKPALAPIDPDTLTAGDELGAARATSGAHAGQQVLASLMGERDVDLLADDQLGDPARAAWTDAGRIDRAGHDRGIGLADEADDQVAHIAYRIRQLLHAGWERVEVVTDHGFVLHPTGLPKHELPVSATVKRKGRCARLKPEAVVDVPTVRWYWDTDVRIAVAPGVTCFEAGKTYEHGGVSPQECFIPRILVTGSTAGVTVGGARIADVKWRGLICRLEFAGAPVGTVADIRVRPGDASTSIATDTKETHASGRASLFAEEDAEGADAFVVLLDVEGQVLAQQSVTVGQNR